MKQKAPNELGLYDMSGNVWEWCRDGYGIYPPDSQTNPGGATDGSKRVYRGGSWFDPAKSCRVANRNDSAPSFSGGYLGYRLVLP